MAGAGSAEVAYRLESSPGSPGAGDWIQPGVDIAVSDLSIDNQPTRNRQPDDAAPAGSRVGNLVGTASLEWTLTDDNFHDLVPQDAGGLSGAGPGAPTAEWYFAVDALDDANAEFGSSITAANAALQSVDVQYQQGQDVRISASVGFGDVSDSTPTSIEQPDEADVYTHHGTSLTVGTNQAGLQSATLSLANLARRREQQERTPMDWVVGGFEPTLTTNAHFTDEDQLEAAIGNNSSTSIADQLDGVSAGTLEFENGQSEIVSYTLEGLSPANYAWNDLVNPDGDHGEDVTWNVDNVTGL